MFIDMHVKYNHEYHYFYSHINPGWNPGHAERPDAIRLHLRVRIVDAKTTEMRDRRHRAFGVSKNQDKAGLVCIRQMPKSGLQTQSPIPLNA